VTKRLYSPFLSSEQATTFEGDFAWFTFDLDVDLTPAFHWGTKQLFVYVTAHYNVISFSL
jgi:hypothetical protein